MKYFIILLSALTAITACSRNATQRNETRNSSTPLPQPEGVSITLTAHDLSEDANRLSTQDDELILLVYAQDAAGQLPTSVIQEYFVLDTAQRMKSFILTDSVLRMRTLSIVLIEMDSNMGIQQLEPIVRLNLQTFLNQEQQASPDAFRKLLGDDDFLGAIKIETEDLNIQGKAIEFNGRRLFDSFHYEIVFTK